MPFTTPHGLDDHIKAQDLASLEGNKWLTERAVLYAVRCACLLSIVEVVASFSSERMQSAEVHSVGLPHNDPEPCFC
jgi:hypothetical protein